MNEQTTIPKVDSVNSKFKANIVTEIGKSINCIFQDKNYNYWFATQGEGVYRYDGKTLIRFTEKDGLSSDYAGAIQEDKSGNIWFNTGFGITRFDGQTFTKFTKNEALPLRSSSDSEWKMEQDDLWFSAAGGAYRYDGKKFYFLLLPKTDFDTKYSKVQADQLSPYGVYCTMKDRRGNAWFGTQAMGVCRYDGKSFTWFTDKGLSPPAVRGLFEDSKGNFWFGNNGAGLFRYDGKTLTNFTQEKGLSNDEFWNESKISGKPGPGTLARVWTINEDLSGNLWIGTTDAGVWRYDGNSLTNFTTMHGLTSNAINIIYRDRKGVLWFGTDGGGVCTFNDRTFEKFKPKF